jgi:protein-disulfide isomerase
MIFNMDKIKWIIFAVIIVGIFGGIIFLNNKDKPAAFNGDPAKIITEGPIADRVYGTDAQKVTLIEYGDFQCPACGSIYQPVKDLTQKYQDKLTFIFRNYPLTTIHPNALAASTAAEAAGQQGKYWEMHDLLYETQQSWSNLDSSQRGAIFENYASQLGLDVNKYKQDLVSKEVSDKINRDRSTGQSTYSADSTPTFVIDGQKYTASAATDTEALTKAVEDALKKAYPGFEPAPPATSTESAQ